MLDPLESNTNLQYYHTYRFFSIHGLHPQPPVGLGQSLQGDDAVSAHKRRSMSLDVNAMTSVSYRHHRLSSPLHHLDVKAEALVDGVPLPSDA